MNEDQKRTYYNIITAAWSRMKTDAEYLRHPPSGTPPENLWEWIIEHYTELERQYMDTPYRDFAGRIGSAVVQELERVWKEQK